MQVFSSCRLWRLPFFFPPPFRGAVARVVTTRTSIKFLFYFNFYRAIFGTFGIASATTNFAFYGFGSSTEFAITWTQLQGLGVTTSSVVRAGVFVGVNYGGLYDNSNFSCKDESKYAISANRCAESIVRATVAFYRSLATEGQGTNFNGIFEFSVLASYGSRYLTESGRVFFAYQASAYAAILSLTSRL